MTKASSDRREGALAYSVYVVELRPDVLEKAENGEKKLAERLRRRGLAVWSN